jgi:hypothetical protein
MALYESSTCTWRNLQHMAASQRSLVAQPKRRLGLGPCVVIFRIKKQIVQRSNIEVYNYVRRSTMGFTVIFCGPIFYAELPLLRQAFSWFFSFFFSLAL